MVNDNERLGISAAQYKEKIIIDFSSPNAAKELHVGHLRSTIIGDCLARAFEFLGHEVLRLNHIGDWGTSFGMLITYIKEHQYSVLQEQKQPSLSDLGEWYRNAKKLFDTDETFKKRAQQAVVDLQSGDQNSLKIWSIICPVSRQACQVIYDLLDVKLIDRPESFYNPMLKKMIEDLSEKGLIKISDGAKCIFLEGYTGLDGAPFPLIVQKSDGGYNYISTDMAALCHRISEEKADRVIYVTDAGQSKTHFEMIFKAAEKAVYLDRNKTRVDHVAFGLVLGSNGRKLRTRAGYSPLLIEAGILEAKKLFLERKFSLDENEIENVSRIIGINAIKYSDLSCHLLSDYVFSYERMLRFEGNTAVFILYSYVRIVSIRRKIQLDPIKFKINSLELEHPIEIKLALIIVQFEDILLKMVENLMPHLLCDYLFNLASQFNLFFRDCRVDGHKLQNSRLLLCEATGEVLRKGMELLGLKVLDKM